MANHLDGSPGWSRSADLIAAVASRGPWIVFRYAAPEARLEFINRNCREVFGYGADELLAEHDLFLGMAEDEDRDRLQEMLDDRKAEVRNALVRWRRADGRSVTTAVWVFPAAGDPHGNGVREGALLEITGWAPETDPPPNLTRLLNSLDDGILCIDREGRIRFFNRAAENVLGVPPETVLGADITGLLERLGADLSVLSLLEHARTGEGGTDEVSLPAKDGTSRWVRLAVNPVPDAGGRIEDVVVIFQDVTPERTRREIREAQRRRLNELLAASPAVIFTTRAGGDFDTTFMTDNVRRLTGYEPADFTAEPGFWARHVHPDDREEALGEMERLMAEGHTVMEYRFLHADDRYRWMRDEMHLVRGPEGEPREIVGSWIDITGRKETELELDRFFSVSLDLLCIADAEGRFQRVNPAFTEILGWSEEELLERPFVDLVHPDDRERTEEETRRAARRQVVSFENRYECKDGSYRWFLWKSVPVPGEGKIYATARDITERKRAERRLHSLNEKLEEKVEERTRELRQAAARLEAELESRKQAEASLRTSERRYREIFEHSPLAMVQLSAEHRIQTANPALVELLGYDNVDELSNLDPAEKIYADPEDQRRIHEDLRSEGRVSGEEVRWVRKDDAPIWVRVDAAAVRDDAGELRYIQAFARDITRERSLREQLLQSQKMEAVGELAGGVAHDFNNLLTVILSNSDLLLADSSDDLATREEIQDIRQAAEQAKAVTSQLLTFSRKESARPERLDVNRVLKDAGRILSRLLRDNVSLELETEAELPPVLVDRSHLEQVVMNLVLNAQDAIPDGGCITLRTSEVVLDEEYAAAHIDASPGPRVLITVSDTGHGMEAEIKDRIFEPFFTTKEEGKGTGLGLSTVYGIVREVGGHIGVYSEPGEGTVFKVYLPPTGEAEAAEEEVELTRERLEGDEALLLIDDDEAVGRTSARILEAFGYRVRVAENAEEGLEVWREDPDAYAAVVTDVVLPGMRGPELAARLREDRPELGVLFMSGYAGDQLLSTEVLTTSEAFVEKPFTPLELVGSVRDLLDRLEGDVPRPASPSATDA